MDEWLKELKAGDKVFVNSQFKKTLAKVEKITPKGSIKVLGCLFNSETGRKKTSDIWDIAYLTQATPESIETFTENVFIRNTIRQLNNLKTLTYEQAIKIQKILN